MHYGFLEIQQYVLYVTSHAYITITYVRNYTENMSKYFVACKYIRMHNSV